REKAVSGYPGTGSNRWPAVHRFDAARLFRLALESAPAGARLHAIGDEGVPVREIAGPLARNLEPPVTSLASEAAADQCGWVGVFGSRGLPASRAVTGGRLGVRPTRLGVVEDLEQCGYCDDRAA